jgi:hypothetical protein
MPESNQPEFPAGQPAEATVHRGPGYEPRDASIRAVTTFLVGLVVFLFVAQVFLWGMLKALSADKPETTGQLTTPQMLVDQLRDLRRGEDAALGLDEAKKPGPGRMSIRDAIDLIAERGIASVPPRTEAEVNSHSGKPVEKKDQEKDKDKAKDKDQSKDAKDRSQGKPGQGGDR